jgi:hypothetical protein
LNFNEKSSFLFPLCVAQIFPFSLLSRSEQGSEAACSVTGLLLGLQFSLPKDALVFRFVSCPVKNLLASAVSCYAKFFFLLCSRGQVFRARSRIPLKRSCFYCLARGFCWCHRRIFFTGSIPQISRVDFVLASGFSHRELLPVYSFSDSSFCVFGLLCAPLIHSTNRSFSRRPHFSNHCSDRIFFGLW